ncbi:IS1634 family transposase [Desulfatibacillum aliphaticivorans]|uniref:IS1634 family transposase n=4 Tax=Desulfatibacillum aliphaticivorans TaxID=218208 RepID=UPI0004049762|nr:IS1634 family transposase [Desulfatibacillum aliphaticivorans]
MYIRIVKSKQRGKVYQSVQIAESVREPGVKNPRTKIIAHLGQVDKLKEKDVDNIINGLCKAIGRPARDDFAVDYAKDFGHIWSIVQIWKHLRIGLVLERHAKKSGAEFDLPQHILLMAANRLCDPRSKLGLLAWLEGVYFPGVDGEQVEYHHLMRAMDWLISQKDSIERELAQEHIDLFNKDSLDLVFYDITSTYFEGDKSISAEDIRAYGYSRDHRPDRRQIVIGMVITPEGIPLCHHVFSGNTVDKTTVAMVVKDLKDRFGIRRAVVVGDRGMLSDDNLDALLTEEFGYVVAHPLRRNNAVRDFIKASRKDLDHSEEAEEQFTENVCQGVKFVMAYDPARAAQVRRHRMEAITKADALIKDVKARLRRSREGRQRGRPLTQEGALFQIRDYLKKRDLLRYYELSLADNGGVSVRADRKTRKWEDLIDGKLVVECTELDLPPKDVIARYKDLQTIERGFRSLKSTLELRPVYHWSEQRIRAHVFICVLALMVERYMSLTLAPLSISASRALDKLQQIKAGQAKLHGMAVPVLTRVEEEHRAIYTQLEISFPKIKSL